MSEPGAGPVLLSNGFQSEYEVGFANGLAGAGLRPTLVGSDNTLRDRLDARVRCVNLRGSQDTRRSRWAKSINILRYLARYLWLVHRTPARTVHVIGLFSMPSPWAWLFEALLLRWVAARFVLTVHNLLPHDAHHRVNQLLFRAIYRLPDALVVHTPRMKAELVRAFGVPAERITVMEHGVDRVSGPDDGDAGWLRRECGVADDRPLVLFFGKLARYKGLDLLLAAFDTVAQRTNALLVVAGSCGDAALRASLGAPMAALHAAGRVRWFDGFIPEEQVLAFFHGSDLLVMPYRHIDQSGVMMMALSTGLPVVATDVGSLADYAPLSGGRVVPPEDVAALALAIVEALGDAPRRNRGRVVQEAERFLWRRTVRVLLPVYAAGHR